MIERNPVESIEDISSLYLKRGLSVDVNIPPRTPINTDNTGTCHPDWSLEYWTKPRTPYEMLGSCLGLEDLGKLLKTIRFSSVEMLIEEVVDKIKNDFKIKCIEARVLQDFEDREDLLLVEIFVDEIDPKRVIKLWKQISTAIRKEIDNKFGDKSKEYQLKLLISVKPNI